MNCDHCFDDAKYKQVDYETLKKQVKQYAVTHQKDMAIYQESGTWLYMEAQQVISSGIPYREIVSKYP